MGLRFGTNLCSCSRLDGCGKPRPQDLTVGSSVLWLPRSPGLKPLKFFDHLKELVYRDGVTTQMDLVSRLHAACTSVDTALLRCEHLSIPIRSQTCRGNRVVKVSDRG
ncbi:hypothetical protein TNCV_1438391 [Trichonephila clavipes]|nr:hypothetical protein TNCV_1438391 [Trichonephila clavipes]